MLSGSGDNTHPLTFHFKAGTIDNDGKERIEKEVTSQDYKTIHDAMMMSGSALEEGERKQQSLLGHKDDKDHKGRGQHDDKQQQQKMSLVLTEVLVRRKAPSRVLKGSAEDVCWKPPEERKGLFELCKAAKGLLTAAALFFLDWPPLTSFKKLAAIWDKAVGLISSCWCKSI